MCGLAGIYARQASVRREALLLAMAGELRHRGPDGTGLYLDGRLGMANTRLAIVDLDGGDQPLSNEDGRYWAMQNGEIYNYVELRAELEALGHRFATQSDTEVIAHAYEEWGAGLPRPLQRRLRVRASGTARRRSSSSRAIASASGRCSSPSSGGDLCFASEAKALLRHPAARRELDPAGLVETFTHVVDVCRTARRSPGSASSLPPTTCCVGPDGVREERRWWDLDFARRAERRPSEARLDELRRRCSATRRGSACAPTFRSPRT